MINIYVLHTGRMRAAQRHINIYTHTFCSHPPPFFQPGSSTPLFFKNNNETHNSDVKEKPSSCPVVLRGDTKTSSWELHARTEAHSIQLRKKTNMPFE